MSGGHSEGALWVPPEGFPEINAYGSQRSGQIFPGVGLVFADVTQRMGWHEVPGIIRTAQTFRPVVVNVDFVVLAEVSAADMAGIDSVRVPVVQQAQLAHEATLSIAARLAVSTELGTLISGRAETRKVAPDQLLATTAGSGRRAALRQVTIPDVQQPAPVVFPGCASLALHWSRHSGSVTLRSRILAFFAARHSGSVALRSRWRPASLAFFSARHSGSFAYRSRCWASSAARFAGSERRSASAARTQSAHLLFRPSAALRSLGKSLSPFVSPQRPQRLYSGMTQPSGPGLRCGERT